MPSTNFAYVNGRFILEDRASVPISDRGFLYGDGVFETMRVYDGKLFRAFDHMLRLTDGMKHLGIASILTPDELCAVCRVLIQRNNITAGAARMYITRSSTVVTAQHREFSTQPRRAIFSSMRIDPQLSRFKTANRLPYILAQQEAGRGGADDAVLFNTAGNAVEFTASNLFVVSQGRITTPPLTDGALPGITRAAIITLARALNLEVRIESIRKDHLLGAEEIFATNSLLEIVPVSRLERHELGHRTATRLREAFRQCVRQELALPKRASQPPLLKRRTWGFR